MPPPVDSVGDSAPPSPRTGDMLTRLERDRLLRARPNDANRRALLLVLTAKGRRALERIEPKRATWACKRENSLDGDALESAEAFLAHLRVQLGRARQDSNLRQPA